jgi:hypothetical protein
MLELNVSPGAHRELREWYNCPLRPDQGTSATFGHSRHWGNFIELALSARSGHSKPGRQTTAVFSAVRHVHYNLSEIDTL